VDWTEHARKQLWPNLRHYCGICLERNEKTIRNMLRWPEYAPKTGLWPAGIRRFVTHPTPTFGDKYFITSCTISYLRVLDQRVSVGHGIMSQKQSCAVNTNYGTTLLFSHSLTRVVYEMISLCLYTSQKDNPKWLVRIMCLFTSRKNKQRQRRQQRSEI
jgi:hypothetical protein